MDMNSGHNFQTIEIKLKYKNIKTKSVTKRWNTDN